MDTCLRVEAALIDYGQLFAKLASLEGEITIDLKEDDTPIVKPPRRIPHAIKGKLMEKLNKMEEGKIITKVKESTD